mmetsp:Transcript_32659/g.75146  ORF Transcript_32659/g.75146 Transcript_32659/m.75146 type:complete len:269 (+) Transcript_32659:1826-2632(+)
MIFIFSTANIIVLEGCRDVPIKIFAVLRILVDSRKHLRKADENNPQDDEKGHETLEYIEHTTRKHGEIDKHVPQIAKHPEPENRHGQCSSGAEPLGVSGTNVHLNGPEKYQENETDTEQLVGIVQPNVQGLERQKGNHLDGLTDKEINSSDIEREEVRCRKSNGRRRCIFFKPFPDRAGDVKGIKRDNQGEEIEIQHQNQRWEPLGNLVIEQHLYRWHHNCLFAQPVRETLKGREEIGRGFGIGIQQVFHAFLHALTIPLGVGLCNGL